MSLTSELSRSGSPVRAYVEFVATLVCETKRGSLLEESAKKLLGFDTIPKTPAVAPVAGANPGTVGTAFDYRLRYDLALYPCTDTVAAHSLLLVGQAEPALAQAIQAFLADTDRLATDLAADRCRLSDSDNRELIRRCVVLALLESVYRSGMYSHLLPVPEQLINLVSDLVVADVEALYRSALTVFEPLAGPVRAGQVTYLANPTFAGSPAVGGADADMVIGDLLVELKTTKTLDAAALRSALLQLVGYCLLDYDDTCGVRQVGVYFARQELLRTWPLWMLVFPPAEVIAWVNAGTGPGPDTVDDRLTLLRSTMAGVATGRVSDFTAALAAEDRRP